MSIKLSTFTSYLGDALKIFARNIMPIALINTFTIVIGIVLL